MIDCHENPSGFSRNDDKRVDCHKSTTFDKVADSSNDEKPYWAKYCTNSRNDESICIFARNDNPTLSLQANKSLENKPK